jgi:3-methyladenine DNA glycosylase AlkD
MKDENILKAIRLELKNQINENYKKNNSNFFKEEIKIYGVRTPKVRLIAKKYFEEIKNWEKNEILNISEKLFKTGYNEEATIAIQWLRYIKKSLEEKDFEKLKKFTNYIDNWSKCDDFCLNVLSHFIVKYPNFKQEIKDWSESKNRWKRRISAVVFIKGGSIWKVHPNYLQDIFEIAQKLLKDPDDLVQKGYGWMLKVTADTHQQKVFEFVMKNKKEMPRTALRYAIEKMPANLKKQAMKK